jgi:tight adherence protein B
MSLLLNPVNVLLAFMVGAGVFALIVSGFYEAPLKLSEVERLFGRGEAPLSPGQRLQLALDDARLPVKAGEFLRVSALLSVLCGLALYALSGAVLAGLLGSGLGSLAYWLYLTHRAARTLAAYEDDLPLVVARLITGAQIEQGPLSLAAEHVSRFGPPSAREDWLYIARELRGGAPVAQVLRVVSERRGSQVLNALFELLLLVDETKRPLGEVLPLIQESLEERVKVLRKARTKLGGPIRQLWIVSALPFVAVIELRLLLPEAGAVFGTLLGQLLLSLVWTVVLIAFVWAYRSFSAMLRDETRFIGALRSRPRPRLSREAPAQGEAIRPSETRRASPPSGLAAYTAPSVGEEGSVS